MHGPELRGTQATLRNLTIVGAETGDGIVLDDGLIVTGGAPTLEFVAVGR